MSISLALLFGLLLALGLQTQCPAAEGLQSPPVTLVADGRPSAAICLADAPTRAAQMAAYELQHHIRLMTGAEVPMIAEDEAWPGPRIYVGETRAAAALGLSREVLDPQEYMVLIRPDAVYLIGQDAQITESVVYNLDNLPACQGFPGFWEEQGTLHAAYDFLGRLCGVRWLNPTELGTVYPETATLTVQGDDIRRRPGFEYRDAIGATGDNAAGYDAYVGLWPGDSMEFQAWDKAAYAELHRRFPDGNQYQAARRVLAQLFLLRMRNGGTVQRCNHSLYGYYARYWDDPATRRPDMFAKGYEGTPPQMCYSSRELVEQLAEDARNYYDGKQTGADQGIFWRPALPNWFPVEPMDNGSFCKCEACQAWLRFDGAAGRQFSNGTHSDYFFSFVNEVARELRKTHPDRSVVTLAYASHADLPKGAQLDPSVAVQFCFACNRAPYARDGYEHEIDMLKRWAAADPERPLYLWLYYTFPVETARNGGAHCFPGFFAHTIGEQMRLFHELGVRGMFHCGYGQDVEAYVTFRLMDDPTLNVDALLDEYFAGLYGSAAEPMKQLYLQIESAYCDPSLRPSGGATASFQETNWRDLGSGERMETLQGLFDRARALAQTDREKRNVELFDLAVWSYMVEGRSQYLRTRQTPIPAISIPRTTGAGGDPGKVAWDQAASLPAPWYRNGSDEPAKRRLSGRIAHDGEFLYLELVDQCDTSKLTSSAMVFPYDDWEIFVAAQRGLPYRQYACNPAGLVVALSHGEVNFRTNVALEQHSCRVVSDASATDRWVTRMSWSLKDIIQGGVEPGGKFYLNALRISGLPMQSEDRSGIASLVPFTHVHETTRLAEVTLE